MENKRSLIKITLISLLFSTILSANTKLNEEQLKKINIIYNVSKNINASNGYTFEKEVSAISLTETSSGTFSIGDTINKKTKKRNKIKDSSLGIMQIKLSTARFISKKVYSLNYLKNKSDEYIVNKLLVDISFSAIIATHYLRYNYEKTKYNLSKTISRYNGGDNNITYINKVKKNKIIINSLLKNKKIDTLD